MAEAALVSALKQLAVVASKKGLEYYKVYDHIQPMQHNLEMIQAFLRNADSNQHNSELGKFWVNEVKEVADNIGGAVDVFLDEFEENRKKSPEFLSKLKNVVKQPKKINTLNYEFKAIEKQMEDIFKTRTQLGVQQRITEIGTGSKEPAQSHLRPSKPFHIVDSEIVGFNADKRKIISQLLDEKISRRTVLSIVGVGGLGKTTLAQKVYKSAELSGKFPCRAWVSISQQFDANKIRREILNAVEPSMKERNLSDDEVWPVLQESLSRKRYLVILDDVWTDDVWAQLKPAFPDTQNESRVIITTRNLNVALEADRNTEPYKLDYLSEDESLALLFRKALQQEIHPDKYPSSLVEVAKVLCKKCGRVPLALVVLGGMLTKIRDHTYTAWKKVNDNFYWHSKQEKGCMEALRLSYVELNYDQKQCFMYFAVFPEVHKIDQKLLKRLWILDEIIPVDGPGTMEDLADKYLEDHIKSYFEGSGNCS